MCRCSVITLWGRKTSSNVQVVVWCLEELKLPYKRIDAGFIYGVVDTDEYAQMNPNRTVPTIRDGDDPPLYESSAIARYLANNYANDDFWPSDPKARAQVDMWAEWSKLNVTNPFVLSLFWPIVRLDPALRNYDQIKAALNQLSAKLDIANEQLSKSKFLATDQVTLADIVFAHVLYRYFDIDMAELNLSRQEHRHIRSYYDRLTQTSTCQKSVMIPYDELRFVGSHETE